MELPTTYFSCTALHFQDWKRRLGSPDIEKQVALVSLGMRLLETGL
jgi:hypothetical protein